MVVTYEGEAHVSAHVHACVLQRYMVGLRGGIIAVWYNLSYGLCCI